MKDFEQDGKRTLELTVPEHSLMRLALWRLPNNTWLIPMALSMDADSAVQFAVQELTEAA